HRRNSGGMALRPWRDREPVGRDGRTWHLYAEDDRGPGGSEERGPAVPAHGVPQARPVRVGARRREVHSPPPRGTPRHGAVAAREGHPHLGRGLRLDRSPDEPPDWAVPREGGVRALRSRAEAGGGEVRRPGGGGKAVSRLGVPADAQRALSEEL